MIKFEITERMKRHFKAACARRGTTMSQALREFILWYVNGGEVPRHNLSAQTKET